MKKFEKTITKIVVINIKNIDTDQIIGSDHLKITDKKGLGKHLFSAWRYLPCGKVNPEFALNRGSTNFKVLVAGDNFGCGSSREHAAWALLDFGIQVVISSSIADIFFNNSIKNGLLPIQVSESQLKYLLSKDGETIEVDLLSQKISCQTETNSQARNFHFELEPFAKYCLLNGIEQLDFLIGHVDKIEKYEHDKRNN